MGIAAASAPPESSAANTSAERAQGTISAFGTNFSAASWLNEPGSPLNCDLHALTICSRRCVLPAARDLEIMLICASISHHTTANPPQSRRRTLQIPAHCSFALCLRHHGSNQVLIRTGKTCGDFRQINILAADDRNSINRARVHLQA